LPLTGTAAGRYRDKMRRQGMRLVQFWAPDTRAPGFADECRRQSALVAAQRRHERQILDEIGALSAEIDIGPAPEFAMPSAKKTKKK
jgi:hypothetical protein